MATQSEKEIAGLEAGREVRQKTLESCRALKITENYVIRNLKRLSKFKAEKPFHYQGDIYYSKLLHFPDVQLNATKELATLLDMYPHKDEEHGRPTHPDMSAYMSALNDALPDIWKDDPSDK